MRVYISGAISGIEDYKDHFARAEAHLKADGYTAVNPTSLESVLPQDATYEEYMTVDFALLDICDAVYMLNGWKKSCGANREYGYAIAKGKTIMFDGK